MRKYFCDRCGKHIDNGKKYWLIHERPHRIKFSRNPAERCKETEREICAECQASFWKWWSEGKVDVN